MTPAQENQHVSARQIVLQKPPVCPDLARRMNLRGMVKLLVTVSPDGSVKSVEVLGGHPLLANAAEIAVREWRWTSAAAESKEVVEMKFQRN